MSSGKLDSVIDARINMDGHPVVVHPSHGLLLARVNTSSPLDKCHIFDYQIFDMHNASSNVTSVKNYINDTQHGTWLLGITKYSIHAYIHLAKDFILSTLGIDMTLMTEAYSKMAFAVRKGDKSTAKVSTAIWRPCSRGSRLNRAEGR